LDRYDHKVKIRNRETIAPVVFLFLFFKISNGGYEILSCFGLYVVNCHIKQEI